MDERTDTCTTARSVEQRVPILSDADIVVARRCGRELASELGFSSTDLVLITTAISELARNIVLYAQSGVIVLRTILDHGTPGILVAAVDQGPGIADVELAVRDGFSTSGNLGLGLPGVRRLMDEMQIRSEVGKGTTVTVCKWKL
jgi:serine/threonine-protein kinase RsbT